MRDQLHRDAGQVLAEAPLVDEALGKTRGFQFVREARQDAAREVDAARCPACQRHVGRGGADANGNAAKRIDGFEAVFICDVIADENRQTPGERV